MKRWIILAAVCGASVAMAQDFERGRGGGRGPGGPGGPGWGPGGPGWDRGAMAERFGRRLAEQLELTAEQRMYLDEIITTQAETAPDGDPGELWREMREARESGDEQRIGELRREMQARGEMMRGRMESLFEQLDPILTDDQRVRLVEVRGEMGRRMNEMREREGGMELIRRMRSELDFNEEQSEIYDGLTQELREQVWSRERGQAMREIAEAMRAEAESGNPDPEVMEALQAEMRELRPDPRAAFENFMGQVEEMLSDEQRQKLSELRAEVMQPASAPGGPDARRGPTDIRTLFRTIRRLDLDPEQREKVVEIEREAQQKSREIDRRDRESQEQLAVETAAEIRAMLNPEQQQQFDRLVGGGGRGERLMERRGRGERGERGERRERRADQPSPQRP